MERLKDSYSISKLSPLLEQNILSILIVDQHNIIQYLNAGARRIHQYSAQELTGQPIDLVLPKQVLQAHEKFMAHAKTNQQDFLGSEQLTQVKRKDGSLLTAHVSISETMIDQQKTMTILISSAVRTDSNHHAQKLIEYRQMQNQLSRIANIQERYIEGESIEAIFDDILQYLLNYTDSGYGFIGSILTDYDGSKYLKSHAITNIAWNEKTRDFYKSNAPSNLEFRNLDNLFGHTIKTGEMVIANNPASDPRAGGLPKGHPPLNTYLGIPILGVNGLIAMFGVANRPGGYDQALVNTLKPVTHLLAGIIESSRHYALIREMADLDGLTKIYNRHYFEKKLKSTIITQQSLKGNFFLVMLDLNNFKKTNDIHGHSTGDQLLVTFSEKVAALLEKEECFARIGGDEFMIITYQRKTRANVEQLANQIIQICQQPFHLMNKKISINVSIGIVEYPWVGDTFETLIKHVDFTLYEAKKQKNHIAFYDATLSNRHQRIATLEQSLEQAFEKKEFYCVFQPQVDLITGNIIGCEALLRWQHPSEGLLLPGTFIDIIERAGYAKELNLYVLNHVLHSFSDIKPSSSFNIAINISPHLDSLPEHLKELSKIIAQFTAPANTTIELEIIESSFGELFPTSDKELLESIHLLKTLGINISIDDFGIEYSSISRLIQYPFDTIKIDQIFIQKLDRDEARPAQAVVKAIVSLTKDLGIRLIAEGVTSEAQKQRLISLGCHLAQGYYYYKPMPFKQFKELIAPTY